jgi:hypothetical protein
MEISVKIIFDIPTRIFEITGQNRIWFFSKFSIFEIRTRIFEITGSNIEYGKFFIAIFDIRGQRVTQISNIGIAIERESVTKKACNFENRGYLKTPIFESTEKPSP